MKLFTAPENPQYDAEHPVNFDEPTIFLAGSIEQDKAKPWQKKVIHHMKDLPVIIFNPRRASWDASLVQDISNPVFNEQVNWELDKLHLADIVFFYFQAGTMSPISLMELGDTLATRAHRISGRGIIVVCEPGFWRLGNVQIMCKRYNVRLQHMLDAGLDHLVEMTARFACGH